MERGGPGYLHALVLIFAWNSIKGAVVGVLTPALSDSVAQQVAAPGAPIECGPAVGVLRVELVTGLVAVCSWALTPFETQRRRGQFAKGPGVSSAQ